MAGPGVRDIETGTATASTSVSVNKPTDIEIGDILVLVASGGETLTWTTPTGFAALSTPSDRMGAWWRRVDGQEPSSWTLDTGATSGDKVAAAIVIRHVADPTDADLISDTSLGTTVDTGSITVPTGNGVLLYAFSGDYAGAETWSAAGTEIAQFNTGGGDWVNMAVFWERELAGTESRTGTSTFETAFGEALIASFAFDEPQGSFYRDQVMGEPSLLHFYRLADSSTTAVDETGNANGTYTGTYTQEVAGGAIDRSPAVRFPTSTGSTVQGRVDATLVGVNTADDTEVTVEFGLLWNGATESGDIIAFINGETNNFALWFRTGFGFGFNTYNGDVWGIGGTPFTADEWYHVVGIFYNGDRSQCRLWINAVEQTLSQIVNVEGAMNNATSSLRIAAGSGPQWGWDGEVCDVSVYNGALPEERIQAHYEAWRYGPWPQRHGGPQQLAGSAATIYTAVGRTRINMITVSNPSGSPVDLTLSIGTDAAATRLYDAYQIDAGVTRRFRQFFVLEDGEIIQAFASSAATLVIDIDGDDLELPG